MQNKEIELKEMIGKFKELSEKQQGYIMAILEFIPIVKNQNSLLNQLVQDIHI
ncbi:hypothetical protein [Clostridium tarantellae]|uniref:hypothetical protein n=1 Tax=Clostridium tarantellae TaxID=39493 RepID=UPI0014788983|nr:hypothetical protein [Clostridium tarantellae]